MCLILISCLSIVPCYQLIKIKNISQYVIIIITLDSRYRVQTIWTQKNINVISPTYTLHLSGKIEAQK